MDACIPLLHTKNAQMSFNVHLAHPQVLQSPRLREFMTASDTLTPESFMPGGGDHTETKKLPQAQVVGEHVDSAARLAAERKETIRHMAAAIHVCTHYTGEASQTAQVPSPCLLFPVNDRFVGRKHEACLHIVHQ
jgi:hypothetical protein